MQEILEYVYCVSVLFIIQFYFQLLKIISIFITNDLILIYSLRFFWWSRF